MRLMWKYTRKHKWLLLFNFFSVFGFIMIELGLPALLAQMLDKGVLAQDQSYILKTMWTMILLVVIGVLLNIYLTFFSTKITTRIVQEMRDDLFEHIQTFSHQEYEKIGIPSLITRTTNDPYQVMLFLGMILRAGLLAPLMFFSSIYMIMRTSSVLSIFVFLGLPFLLIGVVIISRISEPLSQKQQKNLDGINRILRENLSGLRVIRAFVNEKFEEKRFEKVNREYEENSQKLFKLMALAQPGFSFLFTIIMVLIIWFGAIQINEGSLLVGNLMAFIEYIFHALYSFMLFSMVFMMYPRASVSANRIQEVLDTKSDIVISEEGIIETDTNGVIEFKNVTFSYPGHSESPVIHDVSFCAYPGETVAFIGSTGSGKSTLIQLIPRFYDVSEGQVLVDGVDVRDYNVKALRQKIGYIPQKALLFTGSIKENLLYGKKEASHEEVEEAAEIAQAAEFISQKSDEYAELLSEGGTNFSGGQKQRLAIARAVIRKPSIYIFDDSFSALDFRTEANLRNRLKKETTDATVLIVAQRVSTIIQADRIIVLDEGNVVGMGTHQELLQTCPIYYDIASSQLTKEEFA